jgi:hypothetical protein
MTFDNFSGAAALLAELEKILSRVKTSSALESIEKVRKLKSKYSG